MSDVAKRDQNDVPTLLAVSNVDGTSTVTAYADPVTHRLLVDLSSGGGDVSGPGSSTDNAVVRWNGVGGTNIQNSGVILDDSNNLTGIAALTASGLVATATGLSLEEIGAGTDIITLQAPVSIAASYTLTLPVDDGTNGQILTTDGSGVLSWTTGASAGANTALSNLAAVAINTSLLPGVDDGAALGDATHEFSDLFLASGGVINWANGNVTLTQTSGVLTLVGSGVVSANSATAFSVGQNGASNPALLIVTNAATSVTGLSITSAATGGVGTTLSVISSGATENLVITSKASGSKISLQVGGTDKWSAFAAQHIFQVAANTGAATIRYSFTGATDVNLTAGTEAPSTYFNLSQTRQHASNTIVALQRDFRITGSNHTFATSGGVITDCAAFSVDGPPTGGTNTTITNGYGLYVPTKATTNTTNAYGAAFFAPSGGATVNAAALFSGDVRVASGNLVPNTNDGAPLGTTTLQWSDLFLAEGAVINFDNGDATLTQTGDAIVWGGITSWSIGTSASATVGTIELGAASDTTLSRSAAGVLAVEGVVVPSVSSTSTLTNKRVTRRLVTVNAPGATPTTNTDNVDIQNFTGLATAITSMTTNLSGTPVDGDLLEFRFTDDGTARGITWGASFASTTVTLPTTTVISTMLRVGFEWSGSTWNCIATA